jgi:DHA2 family multidrug resistance protein
MVPVGMAIIMELFPPEQRGRAMGMWGVAAMAGPAVGPTLGGWLATAVSWHWLFLVNVPFGVVGGLAGVRLLRDLGHREARPFDAAGLALGSGGLAIGLLGVSEANRWGWGSRATIGTIGVGSFLLVAFVRHELSTKQPMVRLEIFRSRVFSSGMIVTGFITAAQYTRLVFVPLELESLRGYTAFRVGLLLTPSAIASAVAMPIGGRLVDRLGARVPVVVGCTLMTTAALSLGRITLHTPMSAIAALIAVQGLGMGLAAVPATVAAMNALSEGQMAQGSAMRSLCNQVAGAVSIAALSTLVGARMGSAPSPAHAQAAYNSAFLVAAGGVLVAALLGARLPRSARRREAVIAVAE